MKNGWDSFSYVFMVSSYSQVQNVCISTSVVVFGFKVKGDLPLLAKALKCFQDSGLLQLVLVTRGL